MKNIRSSPHHITISERKEIGLYLEKGYKQIDIAHMLGRSPSSISYELSRKVADIYDPEKADHKAYVKRKYSKYQGMKVILHNDLRVYIVEKLELDWSPEQISGRISKIDRRLPRISTDGIYKFIHSCYGGPLERLLRYRRWGKNRKVSKITQLEDRVFIEKRPKSIEKRRVFGHWEADFIVSGRGGLGALLVFVERKSRYVLIFKLPDRKVESINLVLGKILGARLIVRSLTIDNDVCFRHHPQMSSILGAPIFFCRPYHSWEKGSVENMNKWIRQYVRKGSDISKLTDEYTQFVENRLNDRPRKCLGFQTPREVMNSSRSHKKELSSIIKVLTKQKTAANAPFGLGV